MNAIETMINMANEARHKAYEKGDPLWHAVADFEVSRVIQLGRSLESDELSDEPCGYVPEPVVEFAPVWKEALPDALVRGSMLPLGPPSRALLAASGALPYYAGEVAP